MFVKTSELTGNGLDYIIALIQFPHLVWDVSIGIHFVSDQICIPEFEAPKCFYSPVNDWGVAGPIIEQQGIDLLCNHIPQPDHKDKAWQTGSWRACYHRMGVGSELSYGDTPLLAAMRCYVTHIMGETVELPDDIDTKHHQ
jgi:hypothetical protein